MADNNKKHHKVTNNRFSERLIEKTSGQIQNNDTSIKRSCFPNYNILHDPSFKLEEMLIVAREVDQKQY